MSCLFIKKSLSESFATIRYLINIIIAVQIIQNLILIRSLILLFFKEIFIGHSNTYFVALRI